MKHKWIWIVGALLVLGGGGVAGATGQLSGLSGSTGLLLIIFLIWYFSKKHS